MFDTTSRKALVFHYVQTVSPSMSPSPVIFPIQLNNYVSEANLHIGVTGYKGNQFSYDISSNTPSDSFIKGALNGLGNYVMFYAITFYGYIGSCPNYMVMPCATCPINCKTCDTAPTFHCA